MARRSLADKVVVITGGARGIGAATARALGERGARVVIGDLDGDAARVTAGEIGPTVVGRRLDVTDHAGFTAFLDSVERDIGPIDVMINNAGIMPLTMLDDESDAATYRTLELNVAAVIHGTREAMRRMKPRHSGHIVNIASVAGKLGTPGGATYSATKHAVVGLCEAVRFELRGTGVDITCVMPTIVRTELGAGVGQSLISAQIDPEDVARAIRGALENPRFEVWVPGYLGLVNRVMRPLPRSVFEFLLTLTGTDRLLQRAVDGPERKAYEQRAADSAPGAGLEGLGRVR